MATYKTKGIILKRYNYGEADRILTIFSEKNGKIKAIAKGSRKILSKLAGNLELFCLDNFLIAEGRNLDIIADAQTIKCYFKLRDNLEGTHTAYYLSEIVDKMTGEREPHPKIFVLLEDSLENIDSGNQKLLVSYFEINALSELGYHPELFKCLSCNGKISPKENYFSFEDGGLVCQKCHGADRRISDSAIKTLRLMLSKPAKTIAKIKIDPKVIKEVQEIAGDYLRYTHKQDFKARRFIKQ